MLETLKNAIITQKPKKTVSEGYIRHIDIDKLEPLMPPRDICEKDIVRLADSIFKHGVLNPLPVYTDGKTYKYITGSRRIAASMLLGRKNIICHVYTDLHTCDNLLIASVMHKRMPDPFKTYDLICYFEESRLLELSQIANKLGLSVAEVKTLKQLEHFDFDERRKLSQIGLEATALIELTKLTHRETRTAVIDRLYEEYKKKSGNIRKIVREIRDERAANNLNGTTIIDNTFSKLIKQIKTVNKFVTLKKQENARSTSYTVLVPKSAQTNVSRET